jgi:hypothetical protein
MSETNKDIYTEVPASSAMPKARPIIDVPSINSVLSSLETILNDMDSSYGNALKRGSQLTTHQLHGDPLKQYLHNLSTFIEDIIKINTAKTAKKSLLYNTIFTIINSSYQLLDILDQKGSQDDDTSDMVCALNSALLGFTINNTKIFYDEYIIRKQQATNK